jgi:hypothetical protein
MKAHEPELRQNKEGELKGLAMPRSILSWGALEAALELMVKI